VAERRAWWEILRDQFAARGLLDPESERIQEATQALPSVQRQARGLLSLDPQAESDTALEMGIGSLPGVGQAMALRDFERARRMGDKLGMGLATLAAVPVVGGVSKAVGKSDDVVKAYGISHRPMTEASGAARLHDAGKAFGEDIFGKNALQYFGSGDPRESAIPKLLSKVRNNPDAEVTIYRGVPEGAGNQINPGDWVTLDESVAKDYGKKVLKQKVKARDVTTWPDSLLEFGYYPTE
jgi:hypothetical protein